jgi:hypothetical protein
MTAIADTMGVELIRSARAYNNARRGRKGRPRRALQDYAEAVRCILRQDRGSIIRRFATERAAVADLPEEPAELNCITAKRQVEKAICAIYSSSTTTSTTCS